MPNRHLSRTIAMQSLYEWDFHKNKNIDEIVSRNKEFFGKEDLDDNYIKRTSSGVIKKLNDIDKKIQQAATQWPIDQIPILDKTLLRLSTFELFYMDDIPPKVSINEAVELGKTFGSENTSKFVNGALGTLFKLRYKHPDKEIKKKWKTLQEKISQSQK